LNVPFAKGGGRGLGMFFFKKGKDTKLFKVVASRKLLEPIPTVSFH
jgi:hypothetical protein